jgi:CRISPR type IV-associated protein Csf3
MSVHCLLIELGAPVASADPYIHLDALLSYAAMRETGHSPDDFEDGGSPEYFKDDVPLTHYRNGDDWVWAASAAAVADPKGGGPNGPERWSTARWRTHFDQDPEHQIKQTQINTSSGEFKSYNAALPYTPVDRLQFFYEPRHGTDAERVPELIEKHVPGIGKKTAQGFGAIRNLRHTEASTFDSAVYHNGHVLRSLPAGYCDRVPEKTTIERRTTRPPYWHPKNQCMAFAPFTAVDRGLLTDTLSLPAAVPA